MIKLDTLKRSNFEDKSLEQGHIFKDIKFDLDLSRFVRSELYSTPEPKDLSELQDARAIINSIKNILTTTPGEKLLNPTFGLDLRSYLFEPISGVTSYFILQDILTGLDTQEPRVSVQSISVVGNPDTAEYNIDISIDIPTLNIYNLNLKATLNNDGYVLI